MKAMKKNFGLLRYNFASIVLFEIIYKLLSMAVLLPLIYGIVNYSIKLAGIGYVSARTLGKFFRSPATYVLFLCIVLIIAVYLLINISALIYAMELSRRQEKTHALILLFKGLGNAVRIINPKNMGIILYVLLILPFTYTVMITGSVVNIKIPEFVDQFLAKHHLLFLLVIGLYLVLCVVSIRRVFALNYYTLYKLNYKDSVIMSRKIIKKKAFRIFFGMLLLNLLLTAVLFLLEGTLTTLVAGILKKVISYKRLKIGRAHV